MQARLKDSRFNASLWQLRFVRLGALTSALMVLLLVTGCARWQTSDLRRNVFGNPEIYDAHAMGADDLAAGLVQAQARHQRVLLNFGANWCSDSQRMYRLLWTHRDIRREVAQHFVLVLVDVNDRAGPRRNADLLARFPNALDRGIPALLVLENNGRWLNTEVAERLDDSAHARPAEVLAYLQKWSRTAP